MNSTVGAYAQKDWPIRVYFTKACQRTDREGDPVGKRGRPALYPWDLWMDGTKHELHQGRDFQVEVRTMQIMIRNEAKRRGLHNLRTRTVGSVVRISHQPRRHRDYPWARWLDGERHILRKGADFECAIESLRRQAYRAARERGLVLKTASRRSPQGYVEFALKAFPKETADV